MQGLNKAISFILGLVVVVVFIAIVSGRIQLGKLIPTFSSGTKTASNITPTPSPVSTTPAMEQTGTETHSYQTTNEKQTTGTPGSNVKTIPNTGAPTLLIPFALSGMASGLFLRKKGKKK